ncbi:hypothetical protein E2C01_073472 [Portunus trituberculatus]|uniref:Uncharacterized protein n=1 Tax=Portunus trituberculatus TaxID=210409 RepID=A0A5B7I5G1_PORTR|nr:hypothetical protein [Portunus trituberculatus]
MDRLCLCESWWAGQAASGVMGCVLGHSALTTTPFKRYGNDQPGGTAGQGHQNMEKKKTHNVASS